MLEDSKERLEKWVGGLESRICERDFSGIVVIGKDKIYNAIGVINWMEVKKLINQVSGEIIY